MSLLSGGQPAIPYGSDRVQQGTGFYSATLSGNLTVGLTHPNLMKLDPGGSSRDVTLPAVAGAVGRLYEIVNAADASENLVCKNVGGDTIGTVNQNEEGLFYCDGSSWALVCIRTIALS